jgi:hypothetical protein
VVLVEPGVIKTSFFDSNVTAKKSQDPNSPYSQVLRNAVMDAGKLYWQWTKLLMDGSSSPEVVAKVVLGLLQVKIL